MGIFDKVRKLLRGGGALPHEHGPRVKAQTDADFLAKVAEATPKKVSIKVVPATTSGKAGCGCGPTGKCKCGDKKPATAKAEPKKPAAKKPLKDSENKKAPTKKPATSTAKKPTPKKK